MTREELQNMRKEIKKVIDDLNKEVSSDQRIRLHNVKVSKITMKDIALITDVDGVPGDADGDVYITRMPANFYSTDMVKFVYNCILEQKRCKWRKELQQHEEYLLWFHKEEPYMSSLEWPAYDKAAQEAEAACKRLRNQIRYARR